ncbi:YdeI/OmpD-associated family protein [Actinocrispum sp. NPDC049592]|uniref:YdeI/OmpD-associated family protein n=1 Tax=Actinocrispum sp. NPDC049592 TaxID=3154835 RepID=UPI00344AC8BD
MRFRATIELSGKTATGVPVPDEVVEALGDSKRPAVKVKIENYTYRSTVSRMGGRFMVPLSAEHRTAAGVQAGDQIDVDLELDTEPRVVEVPADLGAALDAEPAARKAFDKLPFTHQKEWVRSIEDAKKPETRVRRIEKAVTTLRG